MTKYMQLADVVVHNIKQGKTPVSSKLPSLRVFAKQHNVSVATAVSCYQELESLGWIESKPKSGFFVAKDRLTQSQPELTQFHSQLLKPAYVSLGQLNIPDGPLGVSHTPLDEAAINELDRCFRRSNKRMGQRMGQYPNGQGEWQLRQALGNHFQQLGFALDPHELVVTHGGMSAVKTALETCTQSGDAVAISSPCFNGLLELIAQMSLNVVEIPSTQDGVDLDQFEYHLAQGNVKAGLFCTSHMNPQGVNMSVWQKQRLAKLAAQYQTPVIEDDVYIELSHQDVLPLPAKHYDADGYILWCGSVSKTLSPGYRLGWCLPGRYFSNYVNHFKTASYGVALPIQLAIADFIENGLYSRFLKKKRQQLNQQKHKYIHFLQEHLPQGSRISSPDGGLVLWLQVPKLTSDALTAMCIKEKLDVRAGVLFTTLPLYQDCLRVNIGHPWSPLVEAELSKLVAIVAKLTQK